MIAPSSPDYGMPCCKLLIETFACNAWLTRRSRNVRSISHCSLHQSLKQKEQQLQQDKYDSTRDKGISYIGRSGSLTTSPLVQHSIAQALHDLKGGSTLLAIPLSGKQSCAVLAVRVVGEKRSHLRLPGSQLPARQPSLVPATKGPRDWGNRRLRLRCQWSAEPPRRRPHGEAGQKRKTSLASAPSSADSSSSMSGSMDRC